MSYVALLSRLQGHRIKICHEDPQRPGMAAYTSGTLLRCTDEHVALMSGTKRLTIELKTIDRVELPNPGFRFPSVAGPVKPKQRFEVGDVVENKARSQRKIMVGWTPRGKSRWLTEGGTSETAMWWTGPSSLPPGWALVEPQSKVKEKT